MKEYIHKTQCNKCVYNKIVVLYKTKVKDEVGNFKYEKEQKGASPIFITDRNCQIKMLKTNEDS